jgi:predicted O-linked N-acetylglucosamine transferase (SPINDLY family)
MSLGMAIELRPGYTAAYYNRGTALKDLNRFEEAISSYDMAIQLKPDYAEAFSNRGVAQEKLKQLDAAMASYNQAINLKPDYAEAYCNLGNVFKELEQFEAAVACYDKAIGLKSDYSLAYYNRGISLHILKQADEAAVSFDKAFAINAYSEWLIGMKLQAKMFLCDWNELTSNITFCETELTANHRAILPFIALMLFDGPKLLLETCKIYLQSIVIQDSALGAIPKREPKGRVRIGYYSADLYYHPVSIWLAEQLENHDKSKVELYAFCLKSVQDPMRDRLESAFDHWIDVQSMSDLEITKLSRELGIDIAIDLNGHTADGRPGIFAARAAPIQLNHLGFPGSMGAEYIDYMIFPTPSSDEDLEEVERNRQFITEKIAYVPSSFTYDRQRQLSDEPLTRAQFGLPEAGFVFTCQNGCQKLMPEVFDIWMEILKAVPGSVLWLLKPNETAVKNLIKEANARGVDAERLIFTAREVVPIDQERARIGKYLASYKLADLFLDTWPYNAGTTAIDALWAGLPVLTKEGKAPVARMAAGALRGIEVPELITRTPQAYQELAIELAHSPEKLRQLKEKVQGHRLKTALFDPVGNTRHIENAYLEMYRRYQEGLEPEDFSVEVKKAN